jgi:hypothetical protein
LTTKGLYRGVLENEEKLAGCRAAFRAVFHGFDFG